MQIPSQILIKIGGGKKIGGGINYFISMGLKYEEINWPVYFTNHEIKTQLPRYSLRYSKKGSQGCFLCRERLFPPVG